MEKTNAYLERPHYRTVRENPSYQADGMSDVIREELLMNQINLQPQEVISYQDTQWTSRQWDAVEPFTQSWLSVLGRGGVK